nr:MAG TPA: hypothetical protein [Caudoviricetes sp.]
MARRRPGTSDPTTFQPTIPPWDLGLSFFFCSREKPEVY